MSTQDPSISRDNSRILSSVLQTPLRRQTYLNLFYLILMIPLGTVYFTLLLTGFSAGIPLLIIAIGVAILVLTLIMAVVLARFERWLVSLLLGVDLPPAATVDLALWDRLKALVTDFGTWKAVAYLFSEFFYGTIVVGLFGSLVATGVSFTFAPFYYKHVPVAAYGPFRIGALRLDFVFGWDNLVVGLNTTFRIGLWQLQSLPAAILVACLGIVLLVLLFPLVNVLASVWGRYATVMLTVSRYW